MSTELVYPVVVEVSGRTSTTTLSELTETYGFQRYVIPVHPDELTQLFSITDGSNIVFDFSAIGEAVLSAESNVFVAPNQILQNYLNAKFPWRAENFTAEWAHEPYTSKLTAFTNAEDTSDCRTSILEQLDSNARYLVGPSQEYTAFQSFTIVTDISFSTSLSLTLPQGINLSTYMLTPKPAIQTAFDTLSGGRAILTFTAGERTDISINVVDFLYNTVSDTFSTRGNIVAQLRKTISDGRESIILYHVPEGTRTEFPFVEVSGRTTLSDGTYYLSTKNTFTVLDTSDSILGTVTNQEIINQSDTLNAIQLALGQTYDFDAYTFTISETGTPYSGYFTAGAYLLSPGQSITIVLDGTPVTITNTGVYAQLIGANDSNTYFIYGSGLSIDETTENVRSLLIENGTYTTLQKMHYITIVDVFNGNSSTLLTYTTSGESQWSSIVASIYTVNQSNDSNVISPEHTYLTTIEAGGGKGGAITIFGTYTYPENMFYATLEHTTVQVNASYDITVDATGVGGNNYTYSVQGDTNLDFWDFCNIQYYLGSNSRAFAEMLPIFTGNRVPEPGATYTLPTLNQSYEYTIDNNPWIVWFANESYVSAVYGDTALIYQNQNFWSNFGAFGHDAYSWRFTRPDGTHLTYYPYTSGYDNAVEPGYLSAEHRTFVAEPINRLFFVLDFTTGTFTGQFYVGVNDPTESLYTFLPSNITLPESYELQNNNGEAVIYTSNDTFNPPAGVYKLYPARIHFTVLYSGNSTFTGMIPGTSLETFINAAMGFDTPDQLTGVHRITDIATSEDVTDVVEGGTYQLTTSYTVVVDGTGIGLTEETVPIAVTDFMSAWNVALALSNVFPGHIFGYPQTLLYAGRTHLPIPNETFTLVDFRHYTINSNSVYVYAGAGQYTQYYWYYNLGLGLAYNGNYSRFVDTSTGIQYVYRPGQDTLDAVPPDDSTLLLEGITATYYITNGTESIYFGVAEGEDSNVILSNQIAALGGTAIEEPYTIYLA